MSPTALHARYIFPVAGPPIPDGVVTLDGPRIVGVGRRSTGEAVLDLGNVAILPGLVNAHTHLDLSDVATPLGSPGMGMAEWIRAVIAHRIAQLGNASHALQRGLSESMRFGTTTLADIAQAGQACDAGAIEVLSFTEIIAPTTARRLRLRSELLRAPALSPHAPYSVHPLLLRDLAAMDVPLAFHLAESREEIELLRAGTGPFRSLLEDLDAWEPGAIAPGTRPLDYLRTLAAAPRSLIIHGNYLDDDEIAFLAGHAGRMSVVYCPRTHAYFGHAAYPLEKMLAQGVSVALGTDSRASSPDLDPLAEIRLVARRHPGVSPSVVLELGTIRAARALGRDGEIGTLEPGKRANLAILPLPDRDASDPYELLFDFDQPVMARHYLGRVHG